MRIWNGDTGESELQSVDRRRSVDQVNEINAGKIVCIINDHSGHPKLNSDGEGEFFGLFIYGYDFLVQLFPSSFILRNVRRHPGFFEGVRGARGALVYTTNILVHS